jgi:thiol-disulfide isomerase/thioredoxin
VKGLEGGVAVIEALAGLLVVLGIRRALTWASGIEIGVAAATVAGGVVSSTLSAAAGMACLHGLLALGLAVGARQARRGAMPLRTWRATLLAAEVGLAGLFVSVSLMLWSGTFEGEGLPFARPELAAASALPRDPFLVALSSVGGTPRPAWQVGPEITLVNYWATWCGPCVRELADLGRLATAHDPSELAVVLVETSERDAAVLSGFLRERAPGLTCLRDPGGVSWSPVARALGRRALPTTVLLDARGIPVARWQGSRSVKRIEREISLVLEGGAHER